jgi:prepilin peptidase CpaA
LPSITNPALVALVAGAIVATVTDLRTRRIPNALTASMAALGVGFAATGISGMSIGASLVGLALGLALMLPGHFLGATGAGDVKLMGAVGAVVGPGIVVSAFLFTAIAGGVLAVAVAVQRQRLAATIAGTGRLIAAPAEAHQDIRTATPARRFAYGPAIAIGSVLAGLIG